MSNAAGGLAWNAVGGVARALSQLVLSAVLARLLGPEPFGLVALGWMVIQLVRLIDPGMGAALVQHPSPGRDDLRFATTMQLALSCVLAALLAALAGPCAALLGDRAAAPVIAAMAMLLPLASFAQVANALLERSMGFRTIQLGNLVPYLVGYLGVGVPLALAGAGAWSLVAAALVQTAGTAVWLYAATRHPLAPLWRHPDGGGGLLRFGFHASGAAVASQVAGSADQFAVSHLASTAALGNYNRAGGLLTAPMLTATNSLAVWLFPIFARADPAARRRQFLAALPAGACLTAVPFAVAAGAAATVVGAVYGPGWELAIAVVPPLALAMPALTLTTFASTLLWSADRADLDHRLQWLAAAAVVAAVALVAWSGGGPVGVAWAVLTVGWLRAFLLLAVAARISGCGVPAVLRSLAPVVPVALLTGLAAAALQSVGREHGAGPWLLLPPLALLALLGSVAAAWVACASGPGELRSVLVAWRQSRRKTS